MFKWSGAPDIGVENCIKAGRLVGGTAITARCSTRPQRRSPPARWKPICGYSTALARSIRCRRTAPSPGQHRAGTWRARGVSACFGGCSHRTQWGLSRQQQPRRRGTAPRARAAQGLLPGPRAGIFLISWILRQISLNGGRHGATGSLRQRRRVASAVRAPPQKHTCPALGRGLAPQQRASRATPPVPAKGALVGAQRARTSTAPAAPRPPASASG